ncbi:2TM domain-containing protein [Portibacter lacus]|uniref:2TM domain-containing protein n=1 Tax=Portibacter lacus TaxID=1099794 RepID=A0AA37WD53_9BACT|nr:2TM domain-containing protein [Portibacter lacus]GLR15569.1 hypothetical protein GCM10007940_01840 [Portibacter lacus]
MDKSSIYYKAEKKAKTKKRAMISLITWAAFALFFIFMDMNDGSVFLEWAFYPIFGWGIGVLIQCVRAFDFFGMGEKWEKEELRKEILKRQQVLKNFEDEYGDIDELDLDDLREIRRETKDTDFV